MSIKISKNVQLAQHTTFQIGGAAEFFSVVSNIDELREVAKWAKEHDQSIVVLGGGSNVLVSDEGVRGLVLKIDINDIDYRERSNDVYVSVGAGVIFDDLVKELVEKNMWGLENLSGIPGSVGAVPIQNVGAYGVEAKDYVSSVVAYDTKKDEFVVFSNEGCGFRYRHSSFKRNENKHLIVIRVVFKLSRKCVPNLSYKDLSNFFGENTKPPLTEIRSAVMEIRSKKFPNWKEVGTAGSFFKNPIISKAHYEILRKKYSTMPGFEISEVKIKVPLGWIIEHVLGMKGYRDGAVATFEKQGLVIVNYGGATARDIKKFAKNIEQNVKEKTDIEVEWEVTFLS